MLKRLLTSITTILLAVVCSSGQVQSIKNGGLWRDTNGNRIQAHAVSIMKHDGVYYMLGEDHSNNFTFKGVNLYSSTDLMNWEFRNTIIDGNTNSQLANLQRICERPCLLYNATDNRFVVWLKYQNASYSNNKAAVFYCNTIDGKYTYLKEFFPAGYDSNDCSFFVDTDGTAYYISTCKEKKSLNLYKLSDNYLDAAEVTILFADQNKEAPVIFKKDNLYYMICSAKTGWDPNQMRYSTSSSLTSGWTAWKTVSDKFSYDTQPTDVITITGTSGTSYLYVGDRWKDPGISESKTLFIPLTVGNGTLQLNYVHEFNVDLTTGLWTNYDDNSYVPQDNWSLVSVSSEQSIVPAVNAFDNNLSTFWHTKWSGGVDPQPHEMIINLGDNYNVSGFTYIPRMDNGTNGIVREFQLFLSLDGSDWNMVAGGWISYWSEVHFETKTAHYMKFVSRSEFSNQAYASASELRLLTNDDYKKTVITPYAQINGGNWQNRTTITIDPGTKLVLGPQPNSYGSYSWSGPNGFYANSRAVTFNSITTSESGTYTFAYLDDKYDCHTKTITITVNGTGVDYIGSENQKVRLYPSPAGSKLTIDLTGFERPEVSIYNSIGRVVFNDNPIGQKLELAHEFTTKPGVYILNIKGAGSHVYHQKFIIP